jgi:hypothetical protein
MTLKHNVESDHQEAYKEAVLFNDIKDSYDERWNEVALKFGKTIYF